MHNTAQYGGGGMVNFESAPVLTNCIFSGNSSASNGGAMKSSYSGPKLVNCTFSGNTTSSGYGGGIYNSYVEFSLTNSIMWGDTPDEIYTSYGDLTVITYSDIQGGYIGEGNLNIDPLFVDPPNGDFHLSADSPVIDMGINSAPNLPVYDFEGDPRTLDGNGDGTAIVDMGVDEYNPESAAGLEGSLNSNIGWPYYSYGMASRRGQFIAILAGVGFTALISGISRKRSARNIPR
jgi:hypothetical protein